VLIIMSLALAHLSQGGCELRFEETKALISKAPCGGFSMLRLGPLCTVCSSNNQVPHYLPSSHWSLALLFYQFLHRLINVPVGNFA